MVARGKWRGKEALVFNGYGVAVWDAEKVLEMDRCDGHTMM